MHMLNKAVIVSVCIASQVVLPGLLGKLLLQAENHSQHLALCMADLKENLGLLGSFGVASH